MPPQLANPAAWVEPTLHQAGADFMVANHLVTFPLDVAFVWRKTLNILTLMPGETVLHHVIHLQQFLNSDS